jgi:xanthine dehydrogenase accessory factor
MAALRDGESRLLHLSPEPELPASRRGLTFASMTCFSGGAMEIYIEPHLPEPRLLVFGNSTVVDLSGRPSLLDDPDERGENPAVGVVTRLEDMPRFAPESTFAVVATHGTFDDAALVRLLELRPAYVGLVSSRRRFEAVRRGLAAAGIDAETIDRIHAPAGLAIGARQPEEVALSILAEIVELRRRPGEDGGAEQPPAAREKPVRVEATAVEPRRGCCHGDEHGG